MVALKSAFAGINLFFRILEKSWLGGLIFDWSFRELGNWGDE
jgi:hypothetical protein